VTTAALAEQIENKIHEEHQNVHSKEITALIEAVVDCVGRELSVGEEVSIDGLGRFFTVKIPTQKSGETITLPTIEVDFEPDIPLADFVKKQIIEHPDVFANEPAGEEDEEDIKPVSRGAVDALPDMPDDTEDIESPKPIKEPEKPIDAVSTVEFIDTSDVKVEREVLSLLPHTLAKQYNAVPIRLKEGVLTIGMIDPEDFDALQIIRKETGLTIQPALTTKDGINAVLDQYTGLQAEVQEVISKSDLGITRKDIEQATEEEVSAENENAPTVHIVHSLLKRAVKERASDIHIEPYENRVVVRFREDGVLVQKLELPKEIQSAIIARLKILATLKLDEQRLPQDGRFSLLIDRRQVDFRLSTIPVVYGEKVVMRILDKSVGIMELESVGLIDYGFQVLTNNLRRSHGMILVTGPTGSGKTTTLYAVLGRLMSPDVNILTLEDPVEYRIESINQSQVHSEIGYSFAAGLRAVVRQDPDIVMLGEIRDPETADMAIHAALTGHIVLSTLHTNDAAGAFPRLIDMKIEPFLITSSIHTVIAQRLARKICPDCKEEIQLPKEGVAEVQVEIDKMPENERKAVGKTLKFYHGKGCDSCGGKGYKGRLGIFEVLNVSEPVRELVLKRSSGAEITAQAVKEGMVTMVQDGLLKALKGLTTLEEVWRVTRE